MIISSPFLIKFGSSELIFFKASSTKDSWCSIPTTIFSEFEFEGDAFLFALAKQAVKYPDPEPTSKALPPYLNFSSRCSKA